MGKRGNGQSIKIWNTEKVTAIHMIPPCSIRHFPAAAPLQMCLVLPSLWPPQALEKLEEIQTLPKGNQCRKNGSESFLPPVQPEQMSCLAMQLSHHCSHPVLGTVSPTQGKWIQYPPSSSNCSSL